MPPFTPEENKPIQTVNMKPILYFFTLTFPLFVFANDHKNNEFGTIKGVVSTTDGQPAAHVSVLIKNTGKGTTTDEKGNFEIEKIKPGVYILVISLSGYGDSAIAVEVKQNETFFVKVQLSVTYAELKKVIVEEGLLKKYVETNLSASMHLNLPLIEIHQNITVISRQLLADQGLISISEALRTVSGVEKTDGGLNDYQLNIRGTDATDYEGRNGVFGYWWNQQEDIAMLEKIEFVKGPASFIVSHSEPGGFVNNITKQPVKEPIASVNAAYGSFNLMRLTADFGGGVTKAAKFTYRINAGIHNQDRAFRFGRASRYFTCGAVKYEPGEKTAITAEYNGMWRKTSGNNDELPSLKEKCSHFPGILL